MKSLLLDSIELPGPFLQASNKTLEPPPEPPPRAPRSAPAAHRPPARI
jgi:hypothetical protein